MSEIAETPAASGKTGSPGVATGRVTTRQPQRSAILKGVAAVLRGEMRRQGMTRAQLAERAGLSYSQVERMLSGKRSIQIEHLRSVTDALLLCPCQVFHGVDDRRGHVRLARRREALIEKGLLGQ